MNLIQKAYNKLFTKSYSENPSVSLTVLEDFTNLLKLTDDYGALAKSGYIENVIANTCIKRTCEAMNDIPLIVKVDGEEVDRTIKDKLIKSIINGIHDPSDCYGKELFLEAVQSQLFIKGESYIFIAENAIGNVSTIKYLRPDKVTKSRSSTDTVHQYTYNNGEEHIVFDRSYTEFGSERVENPDSLQGRFNMVILKNYNPQSEINGLGRLQSCGLSIDAHNNSLKWNNSVMMNAGKSSGIVTFGQNEGGSLDQESVKKLAEKFNQQMSGKNRGKILVANHPGKFESFSMNSQEMDFIEGTVQRAIEICNALDYPPYLLGLNGATFNNQDAAKLSLYENSAIPKTKRIYSNVAKFLSRKYDIELEVECDISKVDAMAPRFEKKNNNILKQYTDNAITLNECRGKLGYDEDPINGDLYHGDLVRNPNQQNNTPT